VTRRARIRLKGVVWILCLLPLAALAVRFWQNDLTANPIDFVTDTLGDWAIRILLASLAMTPLRLVFGVAWPITLRRLLGLFAFFYATLHFTVWVVVDHFFDWPTMLADVAKRPYITVGLSALTLLVPLAATSTTGMIKRIGGARWRRLHRLAYVAAALAVLHFIWLAKVGRIEPDVYFAILMLLFGVRLWYSAAVARALGGARRLIWPGRARLGVAPREHPDR
jgi:sulfoxide reductase heme-binding subunit YedZ